MRRLLVLAPLAVLAALLLARRRRQRRAGQPLTTPPQPSPLAALPEGPRFLSVPWELAAAAPEDETQLAIRYRGDAHMTLDRVDAQETPTQVFLTVLMRWEPPADGSFAWEQEHEATVALSRPLGSRELLHAPVDGPNDPPPYP